MKAGLIFTIVVFTLASCSHSKRNKSEEIKYHDLDLSSIDTTDYLIARSSNGPVYEFGSPFAFTDQRNNTIIPVGKYYATWTDTLRTFAIVSDHKYGIIGIDRNENILFQVFTFDNGPDYVKEGLFRVIRNGKIGYANESGEIVIPCRFECAYPFENGKAKVSRKCKTIKDKEHTIWESDSWYFIDRTGKRIK